MKKENRLVYPDLSYKIVGILYDVYNDLGYGYQEKYYQRALECAFRQEKINFKSQFLVRLEYKDKRIGFYLIDFLIEGKVILEIKVGSHFSRKNMQQTIAYLRATRLKLAILANFTSYGIVFKRLLNTY